MFSLRPTTRCLLPAAEEEEVEEEVEEENACW